MYAENSLFISIHIDVLLSSTIFIQYLSPRRKTAYVENVKNGLRITKIIHIIIKRYLRKLKFD